MNASSDDKCKSQSAVRTALMNSKTSYTICIYCLENLITGLDYSIFLSNLFSFLLTLLDSSNLVSSARAVRTASGPPFSNALSIALTWLCKSSFSFGCFKFIADFSKLSWENLSCTSLDVNEKFAVFYQNVLACVDKHVPLKKVDRKSLSFRSKPWIPNRIKRAFPSGLNLGYQIRLRE